MGGGERGDTPSPLPGEEGHLVKAPPAIVWILALLGNGAGGGEPLEGSE